MRRSRRAFLVALLLTGCGGGRFLNGAYLDETKGFRVALPNGWQRVQVEGADVALRPPGGGATLAVAARFNPEKAYSDLVATISPPNKRLRRFAKVNLAPGQNRTLTFKLRREDLSFIGPDNKPIAEPGEFVVTIGGLTQNFTLK